MRICGGMMIDATIAPISTLRPRKSMRLSA